MRRIALVLVALLPACAAVTGLSEYRPTDCVPPQCGGEDAAVDTAVVETSPPEVEPDTILEETSVDTAVVDSGVVDSGADIAPPDVPPPLCTPIAPKLVTIGAWSIDATEVTNSQYAAFLAAKGTDTSGQPAYCAFNTSYRPSAGWPAPEAQCNLPVVHVDWCDAYAYCKWAGKRLCGSPAGGSSLFSAFETISTSQWYAACSRSMASRFIYGSTYIAGACVDDAYDGKGGVATTDVRQPAGSVLTCRGAAAPYDGLFDMNGNVMEWEDSCSDRKDGGDDCRARGGSYLEAWDKGDCDEPKTVKRSVTAGDLGFRCCSL
jgi:formylglycine-generating enzyme